MAEQCGGMEEKCITRSVDEEKDEVTSEAWGSLHTPYVSIVCLSTHTHTRAHSQNETHINGKLGFCFPVC